MELEAAAMRLTFFGAVAPLAMAWTANEAGRLPVQTAMPVVGLMARPGVA